MLAYHFLCLKGNYCAERIMITEDLLMPMHLQTHIL